MPVHGKQDFAMEFDMRTIAAGYDSAKDLTLSAAAIRFYHSRVIQVPAAAVRFCNASRMGRRKWQ